MAIDYVLAAKLVEVHDKYPAFRRRWAQGVYIDRGLFFDWLGY